MPSVFDTHGSLSNKDMSQLQLTDEQFKPFTWIDICDIIASGDVERFRRWPSDLARYLAFKQQILKHYSSIEKYVLSERLHWSDPPRTHSTIPFTDPRDYQIKLNDHPYAFTPDVTHVVVWSASRFPADIDTEQRTAIYEQFVEEHFREIPKDRREWFVNWGSLQSVPGLEHFHVLLRGAEPGFVQRITGSKLN